jgi:uncharacterized membrane protein YkoI
MILRQFSIGPARVHRSPRGIRPCNADCTKIQYRDHARSATPKRASVQEARRRGDDEYGKDPSDSEGIEWELMCSLEDARIYEIEREAVDKNDQGFKSIAKLSEQAAVAIATAMYPGDVQEVEYEIEFNGDASYEIDVVDSDGKEFKIEVDAATGRIIELSLETWEIGEEPAERR